MKTMLASTLLILAAAGAAHASSDDAWKSFATDVKAKCTAAAKPSLKNIRAAVDPFGSERFGLAVVTGDLKAGKGKASMICVYDKQAKTVEIGGELGRDVISVSVPKP